MAVQLSMRRARLAAGAHALGWKLAYATAEVEVHAGFSGPLIGFLTDRSLVASGSTCCLEGWSRPAVEPALAIHLGADVTAGATEAQAVDAIGGLSAALTVVDIDMSLDDLEPVVATNLFHRRFILGPVDHSRAGGSTNGLTTEVECNGRPVALAPRPAPRARRPANVVQRTADLLTGAGIDLKAGEVVIVGSLLPPVDVHPGDHIVCRMPPMGVLELHFSAARPDRCGT